MVEIGNFLKETRIKQNKSIEDISNITKMNINIIENIELGNLDYFKNDFTYLKYYVKSYANAINVDFESIESSLVETTLSYTQNINILEQEKIEELNKNINTKRKTINVNLNQEKLKKAKSVDWTLTSLITIVVLIVSFLIYSLTVSLLNKDKTPVDPPVVDKDKDDDKDDDKDKEPEEPKVPEVIVATVTKEDPNTYVITNWSSKLEITTSFKVSTWVQIKVNNQIVNIPNETFISKTYLAGEDLVIKDKYVINGEEFDFKESDVISIRYGIMKSNEFSLNGTAVDIDESVANAMGGTDLVYKLDRKVD